MQFRARRYQVYTGMVAEAKRVVSGLVSNSGHREVSWQPKNLRIVVACSVCYICGRGDRCDSCARRTGRCGLREALERTAVLTWVTPNRCTPSLELPTAGLNFPADQCNFRARRYQVYTGMVDETKRVISGLVSNGGHGEVSWQRTNLRVVVACNLCCIRSR